jgi:hypothetical protein
MPIETTEDPFKCPAPPDPESLRAKWLKCRMCGSTIPSTYSHEVADSQLAQRGLSEPRGELEIPPEGSVIPVLSHFLTRDESHVITGSGPSAIKASIQVVRSCRGQPHTPDFTQ